MRAEPLVRDDRTAAALTYNIARCHEELGRTEKAIEAFDRYLELPDDDNTRGKARRKLRDLEKKLFGGLEVSCMPSDGGELTLRGVDESARPCPGAWTRLKAGAYTAVLTRDGYQSDIEVNVGIGQTARVELVLPGGLLVRSRAGSGEVLLDGRPLGSIPLDLSLTPGTYRVTVNTAGYLEWNAEAAVRSGTATEVNALPIPSAARTTGILDRAEPYLRFALAGGAAASLAGGLYYYVASSSDIDRMESAQQSYDEVTDPDRLTGLRRNVLVAEADATNHRTLSFTFIGVGVVLAGLAAWRFIEAAESHDVPIGTF